MSGPLSVTTQYQSFFPGDKTSEAWNRQIIAIMRMHRAYTQAHNFTTTFSVLIIMLTTIIAVICEGFCLLTAETKETKLNVLGVLAQC